MAKFSFRGWGLAAIHAYRAYGDQTFLEIAESTWGALKKYFITTENAAAGQHPLKDAPFLPACNGGTLHPSCITITRKYIDERV